MILSEQRGHMMSHAHEQVDSVQMIRYKGIANAVKESIGRLGFHNLNVHDIQDELR